MSKLEQELRQALREMRYTSLQTGLPKGLMEHHIDAIVKSVLPVVTTRFITLERERDSLLAEVEQIRPELERVINLGDQLEAAEETISHLRSVIQNASHVRPEVLWFACEMEKRLEANDHKGGWEGCTDHYLLAKVEEETGELTDAIQAVADDIAYKMMSFGESGDREGTAGLVAFLEAVIREAADLANFAMMIADNARRDLEREKAAHPQPSATHEPEVDP